MTAAEYSLRGKRIVITRAAAQAAEAGRALAERGGVPIYLPTIEMAPVAEPGPLDDALRNARTFDWIAFTSANAVRAVSERLAQLGLTVAALRGPALAAIGPATEKALSGLGLSATVLPDEAVAEAVAAALGEVQGKHVLLPQADRARPQLAEALTAAGAQVTAVRAYRTLPAVPDAAAVAELKRGMDAVTFASPSAVDGWAALHLPTPPVVACIGPTTAEAARAAGLTAQVVAPHPHTWAALLDALAEYWASALTPGPSPEREG